MMEENFKSLGFKDMHPMQVEAVLTVIGIALNLASNWGGDVYEETEEAVDEMVKLLGGNGVISTYEVY